MPRKLSQLSLRLLGPGRFNEAGAVMPRKGNSHRSIDGVSPGFNEAGAVMPRKRGRCCPDSGTPSRFNEAGAVMPRKEEKGWEGW